MNNDIEKETKLYPEGHFTGKWMAIGIAIFSGLGIPLSTITHNNGLIGIGPAIGVSIGLAIGQAVENKYKKRGRIRPLTDNEKKKRKLMVLGGIVFLTLGFLAFFFFLFRT